MSTNRAGRSMAKLLCALLTMLAFSAHAAPPVAATTARQAVQRVCHLIKAFSLGTMVAAGATPFAGASAYCQTINFVTGAQYPNLLSGYAARPSWLVAGVDYPVGLPSGTTLAAPSTLSSNSNLSVSGNTVRCNGAGATVAITGIDFSVGTGWYVYIPSGGCKVVSITNSNFGCPNATAPAFTFVLDQNAASVTVKYDTFDGQGCYVNPGTQFGVFLSLTTADVEDNWFKHSAVFGHQYRKRIVGCL